MAIKLIRINESKKNWIWQRINISVTKHLFFFIKTGSCWEFWNREIKRLKCIRVENQRKSSSIWSQTISRRPINGLFAIQKDPEIVQFLSHFVNKMPKLRSKNILNHPKTLRTIKLGYFLQLNGNTCSKLHSTNSNCSQLRSRSVSVISKHRIESKKCRRTPKVVNSSRYSECSVIRKTANSIQLSHLKYLICMHSHFNGST